MPQVCGVGAAQSCCASDRVCSLGQCVLPATAKPVATLSQVCGNQTIYCAKGSTCLNGACVLKSATCGDKCCPIGTVCVLTTGGPVCCKSENACGRLGLNRAGVRETQSCCATGSTCLPSGLCSGGNKVLGTNNASTPSPTPTVNITANLINRASDRGGPTASPAVQPRAPAASPQPSPKASPSPSPSPAPTPSPVPEGTAVSGGGMFAGLMSALMNAMGR